MKLDIDHLRQETPGCNDRTHFNNAGAALQPRPVTQAHLDHLLLEQRIGGYEAANASTPASENFYHAFAGLLNCTPNEIAFTDSGSRAWIQLLLSIPFKRGDRVLTGEAEYASNYMALLHLARQYDLRIEVIPNVDGCLCLSTLEKKLDDDVRLVALTHVPSQSGSIQPAQEVGQLLRDHRALYLLDVSQSAGQLKLDVEELGCDLLTGSGRKFLRGPRGTGFIYTRHSILEHLVPPAIDLQAAAWIDRDSYELRHDARRFELWEHSVAAKIALGMAADYAVQLGMETIEQRVRQLAAHLRAALAEVPGVHIHDKGLQLGAIVTFSKDNIAATSLQQKLQEQHINTSVVKLANTRLDPAIQKLGDINRASLHYYNTEAEIEHFCAVLRTLY